MDRLGVHFLVLLVILAAATSVVAGQSEGVTRQEALELRDEVRSMFYHAYNNYMEHAFPLDELRPLSCGGEDSLGGYSLTLIDAMDTLALLGDVKEFSKAVRWISHHVDFNKNETVSIFETNIRVLGGLLSAHLLASDPSTGMAVDGYDGKLLELAKDLGERFLPAFYTPTGIPFGSVNLQSGIPPEETTVTSTAAGGTLAVEFGMLSRLTSNPVFEDLALQSLRGLWSRRSQLGLVGAHIDVFSGEWTHRDAGIGTSIDSFYEYLLKAHLLLGGDEYLHMFTQAYQSALQHLHVPPWYLEVNMDDGMLVWPLFNSLQAFWPGLQVLAGDVEAAAETHAAFYGVWRRFGFTPEGFNLLSGDVQPGQTSYPLRPELAESTYWLYRATRDPMYLHAGRDIVTSIQYGATCPCGYCHVADVKTHEKEDHMESFFLSETIKYLWLLFDSALGGDNLVENGPYPYVFSTEGHLFPIRPDLSLEKPPAASTANKPPPEAGAEAVPTESRSEPQPGSPEPYKDRQVKTAASSSDFDPVFEERVTDTADVREGSAKASEKVASEVGTGAIGGGDVATCPYPGMAEPVGEPEGVPDASKMDAEAAAVGRDVSRGATDDVSGGASNDVSGGAVGDVSKGAKDDVSGEAVETFSGGAVGDGSRGSTDDVSKNVTGASGGGAEAWEVWSDEGVQPLVGRCPTLSFWRHVGVHNLVPFPPSADTVTNLDQIQMRSKQRQMHQLRMSSFLQQAAQAGHVAQSQGQRFTVTVDQQGQLFFQQVATPTKVATPPETAVTPPISSSNMQGPPGRETTPLESDFALVRNPLEALSIDNPTCEATTNRG